MRVECACVCGSQDGRDEWRGDRSGDWREAGRQASSK